jgi:uncharacterized protein YecT (DUF1311 family)
MRIILFLAALVLSAPIFAQSVNTPADQCRDAVVTVELVTCLDSAYKESDRALNKLYSDIQAVLPADQKKILAQAQRAWIQSRDGTCEAEYSLYGGATGGPPARLACLNAETKLRIEGLDRSFHWQLWKVQH